MKHPKILIISHGRWGKDTLAEIWRDNFNIKFASSSQAACKIFLFDALKDKYGYTTIEECFEDRGNRRAEWYELICEYNREEKSRLAQDIMKENDIYVGMRDYAEIRRCIELGVFDLVVWVDSSKRLPEESRASFNITKDEADIIIDNNGKLAEFEDRALRLGNLLFGKR